MATEAVQINPDLTVHLEPDLRRDAAAYSAREGLSLGDFVNAAVEEKLAHLQHEEWVRNRKPSTSESTAAALAFLDRIGTQEVEPGDELPEGYVRFQPDSSR